jgi:hypothetical protein
VAGYVQRDEGLPGPALLDEATQRGWVVVRMKDDWKRIFAWEEAP